VRRTHHPPRHRWLAGSLRPVLLAPLPLPLWQWQDPSRFGGRGGVGRI
jgi:hypothetical protein